MKKTFLKIVGYLSVALGFAGAFLPLVPTTPLLLLALWCFSRSSPKMNAWLLGNRMFGRYLKDYEQGRGIPKVVKVSSVIILWSSILFTTIVFTEAWWLRALLLLMAYFLPVDDYIKRVIIIQAAIPSAVIPVILAKRFGGHPDLGTQILLTTTVASFLTLPCWLALGSTLVVPLY